MNSRSLYLSAAQIRAIEQAAIDALPRECCGLLLGKSDSTGWQVSRVEPSTNVAPMARVDRFEIDPAVLLRVQKELRGRPEEMIGVYHSHPNGAAQPSATDLALSWQTGKVWLIAALHAGGGVDMGAFLRREEDFVPVPISIRIAA